MVVAVSAQHHHVDITPAPAREAILALAATLLLKSDVLRRRRSKAVGKDCADV
jgi:hypothetical protein